MAAKRPSFSFGWQPDRPDHRDILFSAPASVMRALPPKVSLRSKCPPVYNQGRIGSCTGNAIAGAIQFDRRKDKQKPNFVPSRLFIYFNERSVEGTVQFDAGARIRDGIKTAAKLGVCKETTWPYDDTPPPHDGDPFPAGAPAGTKPPATAYKEALDYQVTSYWRIMQNLSYMKSCLASGYPFVFGFSVYQNFFDSSGNQEVVTPMPSGQQIGGHAVVAVGYDDSTQRFEIRNSWGTGQGDGGYFYMPYSYVTHPGLASDFWTVRTIEH